MKRLTLVVDEILKLKIDHDDNEKKADLSHESNKLIVNLTPVGRKLVSICLTFYSEKMIPNTAALLFCLKLWNDNYAAHYLLAREYAKQGVALARDINSRGQSQDTIAEHDNVENMVHQHHQHRDKFLQLHANCDSVNVYAYLFDKSKTNLPLITDISEFFDQYHEWERQTWDKRIRVARWELSCR